MNSLKLVVLSDLHLGHGKVTGQELYERLVKYFYPQLTDAGILAITGDFFDRLLSLIDEGAVVADRIVSDFYHLALTHGFMIRIVRGTFSHDRHQCKKFEAIQIREEQDRRIDVKYYDEIALEYIEKYDLRVLYLPDDLPFKRSEDVMNLVHEMLISANWDAVDLVLGHGYFEHVLPPNVPRIPPCTYNADQFKDLVKHWVIFGHVHTPSVYERIVYNGSFDRLAHGEEEAKGFMVFQRDENNVWKAKFIENESATKFVTIELVGDDPFQCKERFHALVKRRFGEQPVGHVRVIHKEAGMRTILQKECLTFYPQLLFSHKKSKVTEQAKLNLTGAHLEVQDEVVPTPDSLPELVRQHMVDNLNSTDPLSIEDITRLLNDL